MRPAIGAGDTADLHGLSNFRCEDVLRAVPKRTTRRRSQSYRCLNPCRFIRLGFFRLGRCHDGHVTRSRADVHRRASGILWPVRDSRSFCLTIAALGGVVILGAGACSRSRGIYDGFESGSLAPVWDSRKFLPGAVAFQSAVTRAGTGAARITLRHPELELPNYICVNYS